MKCPIVLIGNPVLRKKTASIENFDSEIETIIQQLKETLSHVNGWGLAAPQIGVSKAIFVTLVPSNEQEWRDNTAACKVYINPKIIAHSKETWFMEEGCLSIPKIYVDIERPKTIRIRAQDENGNWFEEDLEGLPARCCCHENDHLNGVLIIDRTSAKERKRVEKQIEKLKKSSR